MVWRALWPAPLAFYAEGIAKLIRKGLALCEVGTA